MRDATLLVLVVVAIALIPAGDPVRGHIARLDSPSAEVRAEASRALLALGPQALPALEDEMRRCVDDSRRFRIALGMHRAIRPSCAIVVCDDSANTPWWEVAWGLFTRAEVP